MKDISQIFFSRNPEKQLDEIRSYIIDRIDSLLYDQQQNRSEIEFLRNLLDIMERS